MNTFDEAEEGISRRPSTGGPAFPWDGTAYNGMTLRDYFAAKAMQANMAALSKTTLPDWNGEIARLSYLVADAMLKERSK